MRLSYFLSIGLVLLIVSCAPKNASEDVGAPSENSTTGINKNAISASALPSFAMQDIKGQTVDLQQFKGRKVFVNLWASWCPPCRREMPSIQNLYNSVDTSKVSFVMLSLDDEFGKAKDYVQQNNLQLPVYYPGGQLPMLFNVNGIPATFIFDENGELLKRVDGSDNYDTDEYRKLVQ